MAQHIALNETASFGVVDQADYLEWKSHFGNTAGAGATLAGAVPEPAGFTLWGIATIAAGWLTCGTRRCSGQPHRSASGKLFKQEIVA